MRASPSILVLLVTFFAATALGQSPVRIGIVLPLTGPVAEFGVATKNGIEMARQAAPAQFAPYEFVYEDSRYDNPASITAYRRFNDEGSPVVLVWGAGPAQAVAPVADRSRALLFAVSAESEVSAHRKNVVRFGYSGESVAKRLVDYNHSIGAKKIGFIITSIAYNEYIAKHFDAQKLPGMTVTREAVFAPDDSDFRSVVAKLHHSSFDALGVFLIGDQVPLFFKQLASQHIALPTFGTDFFDSKDLVAKSSGTMEGVSFVAPYADASFIERYKQAYGNDIQVPWAAYGSAFAQMIADSKGQTPAEVADFVRTIAGRATAAGPVSYRTSENAPALEFPIALKTVKDGTLVVVDR